MASGGGKGPSVPTNSNISGVGGSTNIAAQMAALGLTPNSGLLSGAPQITGSDLLQSANALADIQTQGPITELQHTIAANRSQGQAAEGQTAGYFTRLGQFANQGVRDERNIAGQTNRQLANIAHQTGNAFSGIENNAANSLRQYTPPSDQSVAAPGLQSLTQEMARQKGLAAQDTGAFRSYGALQGGNYRGMAASNLGTFSLRGQEALKGIAQATQLENLPLNAKIASLLATKGALTAADIGKLWQQGVTNKFTAKGLNIRQQLANASSQNANTAAGRLSLTAQNDAVNQSLRAAGLNIRQQSLTDLNAYRQAQLNRRSGGGTLTTNEANHIWNTIGFLAHAMNTLQRDGIKDSKGNVINAHPTNQQAKDWLSRNPQYEPYVQAADEVAGWGFITPQTWTDLQGAGLVHSHYPVRNAPSSSGGGGGGGQPFPGSNFFGP